MDAVIIMTFANVGPIRDENAAIIPRQQIHPAKPRVVSLEDILAMMSDITRTASLDHIRVQTFAVVIHREH